MAMTPSQFNTTEAAHKLAKQNIPVAGLTLLTSLAGCVSESSDISMSRVTDLGITSEYLFGTTTNIAQNQGSTGSTTQPQSDVPYDPLVSSKSGSRSITGVTITAHTNAPFIRTGAVSGSIGQNSTDFVFSDTVFSLRDDNGQNASNQFSDGTLTMLTDQANYQFMARYTIDQTTNATLGVFGIPTLTADMPTTGTASFEGFGEVSEVYVDALPGVRSTVIDHVASSTVDVNFLTNTVNAALQVSGALTPIGSQVDRLSARGMTLTGSSFSGGITKMFNNGERVYPNGTAANNSAAGQFYGAKRKADGTLTPAEVGGVIHSSSADGFVFGTFMAK